MATNRKKKRPKPPPNVTGISKPSLATKPKLGPKAPSYVNLKPNPKPATGGGLMKPKPAKKPPGSIKLPGVGKPNSKPAAKPGEINLKPDPKPIGAGDLMGSGVVGEGQINAGAVRPSQIGSQPATGAQLGNNPVRAGRLQAGSASAVRAAAARAAAKRAAAKKKARQAKLDAKYGKGTHRITDSGKVVRSTGGGGSSGGSSGGSGTGSSGSGASGSGSGGSSSIDDAVNSLIQAELIPLMAQRAQSTKDLNLMLAGNAGLSAQLQAALAAQKTNANNTVNSLQGMGAAQAAAMQAAGKAGGENLAAQMGVGAAGQAAADSYNAATGQALTLGNAEAVRESTGSGIMAKANADFIERLAGTSTMQQAQFDQKARLGDQKNRNEINAKIASTKAKRAALKQQMEAEERKAAMEEAAASSALNIDLAKIGLDKSRLGLERTKISNAQKIAEARLRLDSLKAATGNQYNDTQMKKLDQVLNGAPKDVRKKVSVTDPKTGKKVKKWVSVTEHYYGKATSYGEAVQMLAPYFGLEKAKEYAQMSGMSPSDGADVRDAVGKALNGVGSIGGSFFGG